MSAPLGSIENVKAAGFWTRVCAWGLDSICKAGLYLCVIGPFMIFPSLLPFVGILGLLLFPLYVILPTYWWGRTVGKMILGLRVVCLDAARVSLGQSTIRYVGSFLSGFLFNVGYLMVAFSKTKRGLHDRLAKTHVVFQSTPSGQRWGALVVLSCFGLLGPGLVLGLVFTNPAFSRSFTNFTSGSFLKKSNEQASGGASIETPYETTQKTKLKWAKIQLESQRGWNSANLGSLRANVSMFFADHESYPKDLRELTPKYMKEIPELKLPDHGNTTTITSYGQNICKGFDIDVTKLRDTGTWGYVGNPDASCSGAVFIDCSHLTEDKKHWGPE